MGVYNTYGRVQIKLGDCTLKVFTIDDEVDIPDGVYIGREGVIVVRDGKFLAEFACAYNKYGDAVSPSDIYPEL